MLFWELRPDRQTGLCRTQGLVFEHSDASSHLPQMFLIRLSATAV